MSAYRVHRAYCTRLRPSASAQAPAQAGVILWVVLVMLLAMALGGLALLRSASTGAGIAGSLSLQRSATSGADLGLEQGLARLDSLYTSAADAMDSDNTAHGYYASADARQSAPDFDWDAGSVQATSDDGLGNRVRYVIHRLCSHSGAVDAAGQQCQQPQAQDCPGSSDMTGSVSHCRARPMYRITARADGPRGTVSYVQMNVY